MIGCQGVPGAFCDSALWGRNIVLSGLIVTF